MLRQYAALSIACALSATALGSFEMLIVADNGANTTATRRIHRFDPDSGVYLGAFGNFSQDIKCMTLRPGRNEAYVVAGTTLYIFDYNTGALKKDFGTVAYSDIAFSQDGNYFYGVNGTNVLARTTSALIDSNLFAPTAWVTEALTSTQLSSVAVTANGTVMVGQNRAGTLGMYRYDGVTGSSSFILNYTSGVTMGASEGVQGGGVLQAYSFLGFGRVSPFNVNGNAMATYPSSEIGVATAAAAAHSGAYLVGTSIITPTEGIITRFASTGAQMQSFGNSVLRKPVAMASVLAPEPGTMLALGAGIAALLRRRRPKVQ